MEETIRNAQITSVSLGYEDHGILTFGLGLNIAKGGCCVFGGYALDEYDKALDKRVCGADSLECLTEIMKTVGVEKWENLKGKYIRVIDRGWGTTIDTIGNLMEDKWFNIKDFFEKRKEKN